MVKLKEDGDLKISVKAMSAIEKDPYVIGFSVLNGGIFQCFPPNKVYGYGLTNGNYAKIGEICEHECEYLGFTLLLTPTHCARVISYDTRALLFHSSFKEQSQTISLSLSGFNTFKF